MRIRLRDLVIAGAPAAIVSGEPAGQNVVPWTNVDPEEQMYEYACHDDNYDMVNLLIGARSREANGETTDLD